MTKEIVIDTMKRMGIQEGDTIACPRHGAQVENWKWEDISSYQSPFNMFNDFTIDVGIDDVVWVFCDEKGFCTKVEEEPCKGCAEECDQPNAPEFEAVVTIYPNGDTVNIGLYENPNWNPCDTVMISGVLHLLEVRRKVVINDGIPVYEVMPVPENC